MLINRRPAARWICLLLSAISFLALQLQAQIPQSKIRVLFIGNSYIYFNNLGDLVAGIAASLKDAPAIIPTLAVRGGTTLRFHLDGGPGIKALHESQWDFVILQEQSQLGGRLVDGKPTIGDPAAFHASVREFVQKIRAGMLRLCFL